MSSQISTREKRNVKHTGFSLHKKIYIITFLPRRLDMEVVNSQDIPAPILTLTNQSKVGNILVTFVLFV